MAYTGIRFYIREKNKWSNLLKLHAGFDASFVLDKTTDSANINFIVTDEPTCLKINMWVCLFINADENVPTFNEDGTPKNHEQFIIGGYQYYKTLAGYEVSMKLIEPIERFRGVLGETLSYTNQTSKVQNGITYTKEPYNYYSALKRWLQVTPANTDDFGADGEQKSAQGEAWWNRIKILDVDFLKGIPFADDTFNELSLYDLMFDVYDSGTGRTPVAYFDIDATTGLPYNSARDEYLLKFIRQDGLDKPVLEWSELTANKGNGEVCSGFMKREDGANYATGLVANITNLSAHTKNKYPSSVMYATPEVLADVRDASPYNTTPSDMWGLILPNKIKNVKTLKKLTVYGGNTSAGYKGKSGVEYRTILEKKQYDAQIDDLTSNADVSWYNEGENIIHLPDYKYIETDISIPKGKAYACFYQVEYEPLIDARVLIGDDEYIQQVNQTSSQVDSERFGKFMSDYIAGMAKADYTIQRTTEKPQDYINFIGNRVRRDDKTFMITNVAIRNRNFQYDVFFQLNENHVRKNMSYQAPQNIRANVAIQYDNMQDRKTVVKDRLWIGLKGNQQKIKPKYLKYFTPVISALLDNEESKHLITAGGIVPQNYYPDVAKIQNISRINENGVIVSNSQERMCELSRFSFGNTMNLSMRFLDNAMSGKMKESTTWVVNDEEFPFQAVQSQMPLLYTDPFGEVGKSYITIGKGTSPYIGDIINKTDYDNMKNAYAEMMSYPKPYGGAITNSIIEIDGLNKQKDMLEIFNTTYSLEIVTGNGVELCDGFWVRSRLMNAKEVSRYARVTAYCFDRYIGNNESLDSLKKDAKGISYLSPQDIVSVNGNADAHSATIMQDIEKSKWVEFYFNGFITNPSSILFTHDDGKEEKLLIVNIKDDTIKQHAGSYITLYFS